MQWSRFTTLGKKLQFKCSSVTFMGHRLTDKGVEPDPSKVAAIKEMPRPTDKAGVQRFLGMCIGKFCRILSETVLPLRDLTKQDAIFLWSNTHEESFKSAKDLIASPTVLRYYDTSLPVTLHFDASDDAIGGTIITRWSACMLHFTHAQQHRKITTHRSWKIVSQ